MPRFFCEFAYPKILELGKRDGLFPGDLCVKMKCGKRGFGGLTMKKVLSIVLIIAVMTGLCACEGNTPKPEEKILKTVLITTVAGLEDLGFNDMAWAGLQRAVKDMGINAEVLVAKTADDYQTLISKAATEGADLVFTAGYLMADAVRSLAGNFPSTRFAVIDTSECSGDNVVGITFEEQSASFLAGVAAALTTETNTVGFIGGEKSKLIDKFEYGYRAGVKSIDSGIQVLVDYTNDFESAFLGKVVATEQHRQGADVIYHAAGKCGIGVIEAAGKADFWAIGADQDQSVIDPDAVLCSMVKKVDNATYYVIERLKEQGEFKCGSLNFGMDVDGVGLSDKASNLTEAAWEIVKEYRALILGGHIAVPVNEKEFEAFQPPVLQEE